MGESAFIVTVQEAEDLVGRFRREFDPTALLGVPAHISVLFPFMDPAFIDESVRSEAGRVLAAIPSFAFSLSRFDRFPDLIYLVPDATTEFVELTQALVAAFPEYPPYGGRFEKIIPHLTVAHGSEADLAAVVRQLADAMSATGPINAVCHSVLLIENSSGVWRTMHTFPLADASL